LSVPVEYSGTTTPVVDHRTTPIVDQRQRSATPIFVQHTTSPPNVQQYIPYFPSNIERPIIVSPPIPTTSTLQIPIESMVAKQGKQIRALYELQKSTHESVMWIRNQIKLQNEKRKKTDLSEKVFSVSKNFHRHYISRYF
jgi:hypothetical protein